MLVDKLNIDLNESKKSSHILPYKRDKLLLLRYTHSESVDFLKII